MTSLTQLNSDKHKNLRVLNNCVLDIAAKQHMINLRVTEVAKAVSSFPVFFSRIGATGNWALSAIASFEPDNNLFVQNKQWQATYQPSIMQTYPLFLMQPETDESNYALGIDENSHAFSEDEGEALFTTEGKETLYLSRVKTLLEDDAKNDVYTYQYIKKLHEYDLVKSMDLQVHYAQGKINTLKGLHAINEEKLQSLDLSQLDELRQLGYLPPIYAMLFSIYQVNALIRLNNALADKEIITQVKMEVTK